MENDGALLWPYSPRAAVLAAPLTWMALFGVLAVLAGALGWSEAGSRYVLIAALIAGLLPSCFASSIES
jgi:hypothetical protein